MKHLQHRFDQQPTDFDREALWEKIELPAEKRRRWWVVWPVLGLLLVAVAMTFQHQYTIPDLDSWPIPQLASNSYDYATAISIEHNNDDRAIIEINRPANADNIQQYVAIDAVSLNTQRSTRITSVSTQKLGETAETIPIPTTENEVITISEETVVRIQNEKEELPASIQYIRKDAEDEQQLEAVSTILSSTDQVQRASAIAVASLAPQGIPLLAAAGNYFLPSISIAPTRTVQQAGHQRLFVGGGIGGQLHQHAFIPSPRTDDAMADDFKAVESYVYALQWTRPLNGPFYLFVQGQYSVLQNRLWVESNEQIIQLPTSTSPLETTTTTTTYELYHQASVWELGVGTGYSFAYRQWAIQAEVALAYAFDQRRQGQYLDAKRALQNLPTALPNPSLRQALRGWADIGISRGVGAGPWVVKAGMQIQVGAQSPIDLAGNYRSIWPGHMYFKVGRQLGVR